MDLKDIKKNYLDKNGGMWLALNEETDEVIGTVAIIEIEKNIGVLKRFYVKKEYCSKQIGFKLYKLAEQYALNNHFLNIYLICGRELTKAHKFYKRNGWEKANNEVEKIDIFIRNNADLYKKKLIPENFVIFRKNNHKDQIS